MNEASLQFHIKENDYFGTLATVLAKICGRKGIPPMPKLYCGSVTV